MEFTRRTTMMFAGISAAALVVPLIVFPAMWGLELARATWVGIALQLAWFGFVIYLFNRRASLMQLVQWAAVCLVFRLALGALFGLTVSLMYGMNLQISLDLGLFAYLPGLMIQAGLAPFALNTILGRVERSMKRLQPEPEAEASNVDNQQERATVKRETIVAQEYSEQPSAPVRRAEARRELSPAPEERQPVWQNVSKPGREPQREQHAAGGEANGFDRAARYVGEDGSVHFAAVIDHEGLILGQFARRNWVPEDWAPYALSMLDMHRTLGERAEWGAPERLDLHFADARVSVVGDEHLVLVIFAERHQGDVLNIRINQANDMIRKYMAERYGHLTTVNAETKYV